ncbi:hypothetical protein Micbo1qcDRAFT_210353 [Microdochium bolleyi]|uniref:Uncharacterized protein n=1 Tax=Microdochium bolleyi TaxID=196109 RepID=A0A136IIX3_9PEZI|nr:hypothetical protein Micbo1qcDRAFT_210353 [Microdochium bolleyi]
MQFDTLGPAELNTHLTNDIASSIQSWPSELICVKTTNNHNEKLREKESQLSEKNNILRADVDHLRNEILSLKTEIMRHGTYESPPIQEYIMKTAKQL